LAETVLKHFVATAAAKTRLDDFIKTYKAKAGSAVR
jgi:hypothetical protein